MTQAHQHIPTSGNIWWKTPQAMIAAILGAGAISSGGTLLITRQQPSHQQSVSISDTQNVGGGTASDEDNVNAGISRKELRNAWLQTMAKMSFGNWSPLCGPGEFGPDGTRPCGASITIRFGDSLENGAFKPYDELYGLDIKPIEFRIMSIDRSGFPAEVRQIYYYGGNEKVDPLTAIPAGCLKHRFYRELEAGANLQRHHWQCEFSGPDGTGMLITFPNASDE